MAGQRLFLRVALLEVVREVAPVPTNGVGVFVERLQQLKNFGELFLRHLLVILEASQANVL